jgi:hypothetical protein
LKIETEHDELDHQHRQIDRGAEKEKYPHRRASVNGRAQSCVVIDKAADYSGSHADNIGGFIGGTLVPSRF